MGLKKKTRRNWYSKRPPCAAKIKRGSRACKAWTLDIDRNRNQSSICKLRRIRPKALPNEINSGQSQRTNRRPSKSFNETCAGLKQVLFSGSTSGVTKISLPSIVSWIISSNICGNELHFGKAGYHEWYSAFYLFCHFFLR